MVPPLSQTSAQDSAGELIISGEGIKGNAVPALTLQIGGSDGTNLRTIKVDSSGTQYTTLTSPALAPLGLAVSVSATGSLSVAPPAGTLFADNFDSAGLDTTNRWTLTLATGGTQTQSLGTCTLATTTAASSSVQLVSQPTFTPGASFYFGGIGVQYEASLQTNTHRFWGFGTPAVSFTAATPLLNAVGFEIDTSANLNAVVYSNGTKILSTNLNAYKSSSLLNYIIVIRAETVLFYISTVGFDIPVASFPNFILDSFILPWRTHIINSTTPPASAPSLALSGLVVGDTNPSNTINLSDGTFQWRKATIKPASTATVTTDTALVVAISPNNNVIVQGASGTPGTPSGGILTVQGNVAGSQIPTRDVLNVSSQYRAQSITTTAGQALGGGTILVNRKMISITPTNGIIYWGTTNAVTTTTGSPLFPNNTLFLSCTDNSPIWLIAGVTTDCRIVEFS